ncbi:putative Qa-SNARE protein [Trypanosoma conorhini]|uniref:Putative Qa-SNARE protein n=1 Tax=Trypanosoma conorhini TaxID=83891 RepID=A0A422NNF4_9TRYP|nr:putative Qa-SNARE protein [Trypanosoma conorhini]RNF07013.1 putative Qa-SNARE protein [Trypanosoma conorhini]
MKSALALLADDVSEALAQLSKATEAVVIAGTLQEKKAAEMAARPIMREARSKISILRAEVRRTQDPATRAQYEKLCHEADGTVRSLDGEMKQQIYPKRTVPREKTYTERKEEELLGAGGADGTGFTDSKQVLQSAVNVQRDALISLERAERLQHVTEETGHETLKTLRQQTEQMYQVDEELRNLQGGLDRATREVRWFYRQLAGDRCFLSLLGICVVALAVLVFVMIYKKRHK